MEPLASTGELEAPSTAGDWRPVWTPRLDMVPFVPQEAFVAPVLVEPGLHLPSGHHMDNNNMAMEDVLVAVRQQVEYLLSPAVLQHELFLRTSMTADGWLPLQLLAASDWVAALTSDPSVVAASLQDSALVEVKGHMAR